MWQKAVHYVIVHKQSILLERQTGLHCQIVQRCLAAVVETFASSRNRSSLLMSLAVQKPGQA